MCGLLGIPHRRARPQAATSRAGRIATHYADRMTSTRTLTSPAATLLLIPVAALTVWALAAAAADLQTSGSVRTLLGAAFLPLTLLTISRLPWTTFALLTCGWVLGILGLTTALAGTASWATGAPAALLALASAAGFFLLRRKEGSE